MSDQDDYRRRWAGSQSRYAANNDAHTTNTSPRPSAGQTQAHQALGHPLSDQISSRQPFHPAETEPFLRSFDIVDLVMGSDARLPDANRPPTPRPSASLTNTLDNEKKGGQSVSSTFYSDRSATQTNTAMAPKSLWKIWWPEITYITISLLALIVIVVVLSSFDQKGLPDWPLNVTLNTFLAFFTTLAKAAFLLPVSNCISHAQWRWFLKERPLYDFHVLDQASRGPWGSLMLLWRIRGQHFIALGAVLMVLSTATAPLTQLAINYPVRDVVAPGETASTGAVGQIQEPGDLTDIATRKALILASMTDSTNFTQPIAPQGAFCSTGNCTYDTYQSLGVCVKMANITSHLRIHVTDDPDPADFPMLADQTFRGRRTWNASLPGGFDMTHQSPMAMLTDTLNGRDTFGFVNDSRWRLLLQTRIVSFVLIYTTPVFRDNMTIRDIPAGFDDFLETMVDFRHEAVEVLLHLCVQSFETKVHMGVETTTVVEVTAEPAEEEEEEGSFFLDMDCNTLSRALSLVCMQKPDRWNETIHLKSGGGAEKKEEQDLSRGLTGSSPTTLPKLMMNFNANYQAMEYMASAMKISLASFSAVTVDPTRFPKSRLSHSGGEFVNTVFNLVLFHRNNLFDHARRRACIRNLYANIATTMSSTLRGSQPHKYAQAAFNVTGQAWKEASYVQISWGWISFLAVELAMAAVFLAITILSQSAINSGSNSSSGSNTNTLDSSSGGGGDEYLAFRDIKGSSLGHIVALSNECRAAIGGGLQSMDCLEESTKNLRVRLCGNEVVPVEAVGVGGGKEGEGQTGRRLLRGSRRGSF